MVSFELGYEIEKDVFLSSLHSVGLKKNSESTWGIWRSEVWFLMGTQNFFFFPTLMARQKHLSLNNISLSPQTSSLGAIWKTSTDIHVAKGFQTYLVKKSHKNISWPVNKIQMSYTHYTVLWDI